MKLLSKALLILAIITLIFGLNLFIDKYTYRPSCISLSEPHYYDLEDNLEILRDLLIILFFPAVLVLLRYFLIKKNINSFKNE
jgi:hypothetical protein